MLKKVILITGSNGEIGQALIKKMYKRGMKNVLALDLEEPNKKNNISQFIKGSILDKDLLDSINKKYIIHQIYHLAAILSTKAEKNPQLANEVNIQGTQNMFDLCVKQSQLQNREITFFFPSSIAVYNINSIDDKNTKIDETMCSNNLKTVYGLAKLESEIKGKTTKGIDFRSIRFPGIISATSIPTGGTSDYAPEMIHCASNNLLYQCFVNSKTRLPFIVMPDAIDAILQLMETPNNLLKTHIYNISSFCPSVEDFCNKISEYFQDFQIEYDIDATRQSIVDSWPNDLNNQKAKDEWGWQPKYNFHTSFVDYIIPILLKKNINE